MAIKDEVQGPKGYLGQIRKSIMPNTKEMADLAMQKLIEKRGKEFEKEEVMSATDRILYDLFVAETETFIEKDIEIKKSVLPYYYNKIYKKTDANYSETSKQVKRLTDLYDECRNQNIDVDSFIKEISNITVPMIDTISFSQMQSAKCRVGETLQNHLSRLLDICEIKYETQQMKSDGGTIMDFVVPSFDGIKKSPDNVINIECQTTLKDRFRLTTGKSTDAKIKRYLATATGVGLITKRDKNDITVGKLKEIIYDNNITLVVFSVVKNNIKNMLQDEKIKYHRKTTYVSKFGLSEADIDNLISLSDRKVVSYKELFNKDIQSVLMYWGD